MGVLEQRRPEADPKYLIGRGKLEEVLIRAMQLDANVLIFDPDLTPVQAHAIADFTDLKVIDRTMLILDIFAQRAKSRDGKLQVELAQLRYRLPRLHEKNTMMSRLTGGIGGRGPGRDEAGGEPPPRARADPPPREGDRSLRRAARRAPRRARAARAAGGRDRRLHERRQVDAAQHAHQERRAGRGQAVRDARPDDAPAEAARASARSSSPTPSGSSAICRAIWRARSAPRSRSWTRPTCCCTSSTPPIRPTSSRSRRSRPSSPTWASAETPRLLVMNKIDLARPRGPARLARGGGDLPAVAISAQDGDTTAPLLAAIEAALWRGGLRRPTPRVAEAPAP